MSRTRVCDRQLNSHRSCYYARRKLNTSSIVGQSTQEDPYEMLGAVVCGSDGERGRDGRAREWVRDGCSFHASMIGSPRPNGWKDLAAWVRPWGRRWSREGQRSLAEPMWHQRKGSLLRFAIPAINRYGWQVKAIVDNSSGVQWFHLVNAKTRGRRTDMLS